MTYSCAELRITSRTLFDLANWIVSEMSSALETFTAYWTYVPIIHGCSLGVKGSQLWFA